LGEYMLARAGRRQKIIEQQRTPATFITSRYHGSEDAIRDYLLSGATQATPLQQAIERLRSSAPKDEWEETNRSLCIDVMERLPQLVGKIELGEKRAAPKARSLLDISGVEISVRPEIILLKRRRGIAQMGAVKLCLSKTKPVEKEAALYIAVILQRYLQETYPKANIARDLCQVVDVFHGQVWTAPQAFKQRLKDVAAACREIALGWEGPRVAA
jgi:hypothetical protein